MSYFVHPYKGYLNTKYSLYSTNDATSEVIIKRVSDQCIIDTLVSEPNEMVQISIPESGKYDIELKETQQSIAHIEVIDGYKFGGSSLKNAFLFEETPWVFIVMHDRTYFHNRITCREYVEPISPDRIEFLSYSKVIMSNNEQEVMTVYDLEAEKQILAFRNIIFKNNELMVWVEESLNDTYRIKIARFDSLKDITSICCEDYVIVENDNKLLYYVNGTIHTILLINDLSHSEIKCPKLFITFLDSGDYVCRREYDRDMVLIYGVDNKYIGPIQYSGTLAKINKKKIIDFNSKVEKLHEFCKSENIGTSIELSYTSLNIFKPSKCTIYEEKIENVIIDSKTKRINTLATLKNLKGDRLVEFNDKKYQLYKTNKLNCILFNSEIHIVGDEYSTISNGEIDKIFKSSFGYYCLCSKGNKSSLYRIYGGGQYQVINGMESFVREDYSFRMFEKYSIIEGRRNYYLVNKLGQLIKIDNPFKTYIKYQSENFNYGLEINNNCVNLYTAKISDTFCPKEYCKKQILGEIMDNSSYHNVLLSEDGSYIISRDEERCQVINTISGEAQNYSNICHISHINGIKPLFTIGTNKQARLINPVTGIEISNDMFSQYNFISHSGKLYTDTFGRTEYKFLLDNKDYSTSEYSKLRELYEYGCLIPEEEEKTRIENNRRKFISKHLDALKYRCENWNKKDEDRYVTSHSFLNYFFSAHHVISVKKSSDNSVYRLIDIGRPLWFLNYVSFSYDERYIAIAGRYPSNTFLGGLFLVYDLSEDKVLFNHSPKKAVWMTSFTKSGVVASYSSDPNTYIGNVKDNGKNYTVISNKSFLTFSADGVYVALSEQGYIPWNNGLNESWGHMTSSLVSIRRTNNPDKELVQFNDISGIEGAYSSRTVSSVSFSMDNKKIMMVGNDGVVVIRNLHLLKD